MAQKKYLYSGGAERAGCHAPHSRGTGAGSSCTDQLRQAGLKQNKLSATVDKLSLVSEGGNDGAGEGVGRF